MCEVVSHLISSCATACLARHIPAICFVEICAFQISRSILFFMHTGYCMVNCSSDTFRSEGASTSSRHRQRKRSISVIPEIGDDIVRLALLS